MLITNPLFHNSIFPFPSFLASITRLDRLLLQITSLYPGLNVYILYFTLKNMLTKLILVKKKFKDKKGPVHCVCFKHIESDLKLCLKTHQVVFKR